MIYWEMRFRLIPQTLNLHRCAGPNEHHAGGDERVAFLQTVQYLNFGVFPNAGFYFDRLRHAVAIHKYFLCALFRDDGFGRIMMVRS